MDIRCPRCGDEATPAGHEDARAFFHCQNCNRVWTATLASFALPEGRRKQRQCVRVLVADDSDELVGLVAAWLEDEGYAVVTASSGRQALDAAAVYHPDIVLLDLIMPPPDGFQLCEALRNQLPPRIILMTGISNPAHLRRALDLGVVALLRKPFTREAVLGAVAAAAEQRHDPLSPLR